MNDNAKFTTKEAVSAEVIRIVIDALHAQNQSNSIGPDTRLDALGLDSLNVVDVLLGIEESFGIGADDEEIEPETVETIASLTDFVLTRQNLV